MRSREVVSRSILCLPVSVCRVRMLWEGVIRTRVMRHFRPLDSPRRGFTSGRLADDHRVHVGAGLAERRNRMLPAMNEMIYGHLGRSGLLVSRIGVGTMNFGYLADEPASFAVMDAAFDSGITLFDTADVYGGPQSPDMAKGYGISEETVSRWLQRSGRRDDIVLATKVYQPMGLGPNDRRLSAYHIRRACDASLRRLQTDHIDLYQMHHVDRATPWDEIWQAMEVLVAQGKILYVGSSNFAGWHITQANDTAAARGFFGLVSEQSIYNLLTRAIELEVLPAAIEYGVGVIPWSPLEGGLLGGVLKKEREGRRRGAGRAADTLRRHQEQIAAYEALCDELGEQPAHVALAWLLHQEGVTGPIIGPRTEDQLDDAQHAITVHLGEDVLKRLDDIFPGYRPAPEHYAW